MPKMSRQRRRVREREAAKSGRRDFLKLSMTPLINAVRRARQSFGNELRYKPIRQIPRRQFIIRGISAGFGLVAAFYGGRWLRHRLLHWQGIKPKYKIVFVASPHGYKRNVGFYKSVIESYERAGEPFHVFGMETAYFSKKERIEQEKKYAMLLEDIKAAMKAGKTEEIKRIINKHVESPYPEFTRGITELIAKKSLKVKSIEAAEENELAYFKVKDAQIRQLNDKITAARSLDDHKRLFFDRLKIEAERAAKRDKIISNYVPIVIEEIKRDFPDLAKQDQVRIVYQIGGIHASVYMEQLAKRLKSVEFEIVEPELTHSLDKIVRKLIRDPYAKIDEQMLNKAALTNTVEEFGTGVKIDSDMVLNTMERADRASQKDFEDLRKSTAGMTFPNRAKTIFEYFYRKGK